MKSKVIILQLKIIILNINFILEKRSEEALKDFEFFSDRDQYLFPTKIKTILRSKDLSRKKVINTSKILQIFEEIEENYKFKHILNLK